jgi:hypothetical protein
VDRLDQYAIRGTQNYAKNNNQTLSFSALQGRTASWSVSQEYRLPAKTLAHLLTELNLAMTVFSLGMLSEIFCGGSSTKQ